MTADDLIAALQALPAEQRRKQACFDADGILLVVERVEEHADHVEVGGGLSLQQVLYPEYE